MSTIATTNLKHPSSAVNNMVLSSNGTVTAGVRFIGGGLDLIAQQTFNGVSSVSFNNCFTSTYQNYRVLIEYTNADSADRIMGLRFRNNGSDVTSGYGSGIRAFDIYSSATTFSDGYTANDRIHLGLVNVNIRSVASVDIFGPATNSWASATGILRSDVLGARSVGGIMVATFPKSVSYDGLTFFSSAGNLQGTIRIYGYENT